MFKTLWLNYKVHKLNKTFYPICVMKYNHTGDTFIASFMTNGYGKRKVVIEHNGTRYRERSFERSETFMKIKMWDDGRSNEIPDKQSPYKVEHIHYYHHAGKIFRKHIDDRYRSSGIDVIDAWDT